MKSKRLILGLYLNYFVLGISQIILAQNMDALRLHWHTTTAGVAFVISALGVGRLLVYLLSGFLSDRFGRRPFVMIGMGAFVVFYAGILLSPNIYIAFAFSILSGVANSCLDTGTYPTLIDLFPQRDGAATVMLKAFMSLGELFIPLIIGLLTVGHLWYGWSMLFVVAVILLNVILLWNADFPSQAEVQQLSASEQAAQKTPAKWYLDGILFVMYGYLSMATFYLIAQWLTKYGASVANMGSLAAHALLSYYSIGSIASVILTAVMVNRLVKPLTIQVSYTFMALLAIMAMWQFPTPVVLSVGGFTVGFFAAGGVMQLGLTKMAKFFPIGKGLVTGIFYTAGALASFTIPLITGALAQTNMHSIMLVDVIVAALGFIVSVGISVRYRVLFGKTAPELNLAK